MGDAGADGQGQGVGKLGDRRALELLERLLALEALDLQSAFQHAAQGIAEALEADKVDVFVREGDFLVALGTSDTTMGRLERQLGLDRLPVDRSGLLGRAYSGGKSYVCPRTADVSDELPELLEQLGVHSTIAAPVRHGRSVVAVVLASSATPGYFRPADLRFLEAVAGWVGLVGQRAALVEQLTERAAEEGLREGASSALELLTPRQREVAALVAEGLTNAEIATRLVLSQGTVANHVADIMRRVGVRRRAQLAAWITHPRSFSTE